MSFNLYARCGKEEIKLWQTPTQITMMICVDHNGEFGDSLYGKDAKRALWAYIQYITYLHNGQVYYSKEDADDDRRIIQEHVVYIKGFLDKPKLEVWFG